jgi:uncharacterized membrane-anchored protein YhcB (DUF1043 family)
MSRRFVIFASVLLLIAVVGLMIIALYITADWDKERRIQKDIEDWQATLDSQHSTVRKAISATETAKAWTVTPSPPVPTPTK